MQISREWQGNGIKKAVVRGLKSTVRNQQTKTKKKIRL